MSKIKRALLSVSDKTGIVEFAEALSDMGVEIISTGGTAKALSDAGVKVMSVSSVTGFPEMMEGRVKTLHPAVHGALLADRSKPDHMRQIAEQKIQPIDLVAVNLYPFANTVAKPGVTLEDAIENIDIGGPSMVRSASKNFASVTIVVTPSDYDTILAEMRENDGETTYETRSLLATKAFTHTAAYDTMISNYMQSKFMPEVEFPSMIDLRFEKIQDLRYGENPHQKGAFYKIPGFSGPAIASAKQLTGKELSFNNIWDANAALELVKEFDQPACAIIKHANPCGCAEGNNISEAYKQALEADREAAFGGIIALNRPLDAELAETIFAGKIFHEVIIAPVVEPDAIPILTEQKKSHANLRILEVGDLRRPTTSSGPENMDMKKVNGGLIIQGVDTHELKSSDLRTVTEKTPTEEQIDDLLFAWKIVKHVKSNAIVLVKNRRIVGVGAGQMKRSNSVGLAVAQAGDQAQGAVLASDAFFPFTDGPEAAAHAGVAAIIQPGGSMRDQEVIDSANNHGLVMVFTGVRHFRH